MENTAKFWSLLGQYYFLENNVQNIIVCLAVLLFGFLFKRFISVAISKLIFRILKKSSSNIPAIEFVSLIKTPIEWFFILLLIYVAFSFISYPLQWHLVSEYKFGLKMFIIRGYELMMFLSIAWIVFRIIDFFELVLKKNAIENESKLQEQLVPFLKQLVKLVIAIIFFFAILGIVFHLNVGAIVAGLGIGGVAVALAGKETLENLLASFSIFLDKPFIAGDLIKVNDITGNVEMVGFRTTRIRTLDKSLITIPNKQLIDQPLENLSSRAYHRSKFTIGLPNETSELTVKNIIRRIKEELQTESFTNDEHVPIVYFEGFGTYSLEITVIFFAKTIEFEDFWKIKEDINFKIMRILGETGSEIEYPTSVIHLKR